MEGPIVTLKTGQIRGIVEKHEDGFDYYAFRGIPYMEPPIGELRFEDPLPKKPWAGVIDCQNYGPMFVQYDVLFKLTSTEENSLYLNVFTRSVNDTDEYNPVIFVVHGGAFVFGTADDFMYGPDYMIRKNIVLVTANYRLGVLGFLSLEDELAPGNQGLKDQLTALQWVQQNIREFGGDPKNVTIMGLSAGACCAHYLAVSPLSQGLFHKMICQSAVLYQPWSTFRNPKSMAVELCSILGKNLTSPAEILRFLKSVDVDKLLQAQESLRMSMNGLGFGPCVDDKSPNPVLPIDPASAANRGVHLPCLVGYNSAEGTLLLLGLTREEYFRQCDENWEMLFKYNSTDLLKRYELTIAQAKRLYYKSDKVSEKNIDRFTALSQDIYFAEAVHRFCRVQANQSSAATYLYVFSYDPPDAMTKNFLKDVPSGASHCDEIPYFFKMRAFKTLGLKYAKKGTRQYRMMERVTELWTNFAKYGKPTVKKTELIPVHWTPINDGTVLRYLDIDEDLTMQSMINVDQKFLAAKDIQA